MFLHELEPGTVFTLTDKSVKAERARLTKSGLGDYANRQGSGPFQVMLPRRTSANETVYPPEVHGINGAWFNPDHREQYEVEVVKTALTDHHLPSRGWIWTSADPEVFIECAGEIVPGFAVLPPKKTPIKAYEGGGIFHEDGFQAEFSPAPYECHETMLYSTAAAMTAMLDHVTRGRYSQTAPYRISDASFVELSPELLAVGSDDQVALGCDRSENVWGHTAFRHDNPREFPYRMAGGHIHFGTPDSAKWFHSRAERIIKAMDLFVGVPSVALFAGIEDPRRRQYYGRAGEFRYQKHGLEYRVLSNAWLQHPALAHMVLNLARGAFRLGTTDWESDFKFDPEYIRHIINNHDVNAAKQFVEENAKILIWLMNKDSGQGWGAKALTTIHSGAKAVFGTRLGIEKNWIHKYDPQRFHQYVRDHAIKNWPGFEEPEKKVALPPPGVRSRSTNENQQFSSFNNIAPWAPGGRTASGADNVERQARAVIRDVALRDATRQVNTAWDRMRVPEGASVDEETVPMMNVTSPGGRVMTVSMNMSRADIQAATRQLDELHDARQAYLSTIAPIAASSWSVPDDGDLI